MNTRRFEAMNTSWWVRCDRSVLLDGVEPWVEEVEARLSRFLDDSALSRLNRTRSAEDAILAGVTRAALEMAEATGGAFDPTLGGQLAALGYDRSFEKIDRPTVERRREGDDGAPLAVHLEGDRVELHGDGELDLGGIAKGWTIDRVVERLRSSGAESVLVDAGGDLRGTGRPWPIGLEAGPVVELTGAAIATSSRRRRRWASAGGEEFHHILDPETGQSADSPLAEVTVIAGEAATADALATALLVAPDRLLPQLDRWEARAAVRSADGDWWTTSNWKEAS